MRLNLQKQYIEISEFEISNPVIFNYFNNLQASDRDEKLLRAIYIGVLALMEDRLSAFLSKTSNELGTELESLKMLFDLKKELFYKSAVKGMLAEEEIEEYLNNYFQDRKLRDRAFLTGNTIGSLPRNKTGDIICEIDGNAEIKIVIECKFDKSIRLGDIETKDLFSKKTDTAWSQLIEAQANREAKASLIVLDSSLVDNSIVRKHENVGYIPSVGFVAIINSQKGDYSNLAIAYMLARDIILNAKSLELDKHLLNIMITRLAKDIGEILTIRNLVEANIENNKSILKQLEKSMLLMEFNQKYFSKFLKDGNLNKKDLLAFYAGEDIRDKYREIEKEINKQFD